MRERRHSVETDAAATHPNVESVEPMLINFRNPLRELIRQTPEICVVVDADVWLDAFHKRPAFTMLSEDKPDSAVRAPMVERCYAFARLGSLLYFAEVVSQHFQRRK